MIQYVNNGKREMLFKRIALLGLILSFGSSSYAEPTKEKVFCHYNMGDWYGSTVYDSESNVIRIQNCAWGMGYHCAEYNISKLAEHDGIVIYCDDKHSNIFINDNGFWRWENAGCRFDDTLNSCDIKAPFEECEKKLEEKTQELIAHSLNNYAFEYACPYNPPQKPRRLVLIDKKDKIYAISCAEKMVKVFSSKENPIFYSSDKPVSVNKTLCE